MKVRNANTVHNESLTRNERFAAKVADLLGSPWTIYLFALLASISLPAVLGSHDLTLIITWITQTFIQLVALAVLQAKAVLDGRHAEIIADETHNAALLAEQNAEEIKKLLLSTHVHLEEIKDMVE